MTLEKRGRGAIDTKFCKFKDREGGGEKLSIIFKRRSVTMTVTEIPHAPLKQNFGRRGIPRTLLHPLMHSNARRGRRRCDGAKVAAFHPFGMQDRRTPLPCCLGKTHQFQSL